MSYYDEYEEIAWGPVNVAELKDALKRSKVIRRRETNIGLVPHIEMAQNESQSSSQYHTPDSSLRPTSSRNSQFLNQLAQVVKQTDNESFASYLTARSTPQPPQSSQENTEWNILYGQEDITELDNIQQTLVENSVRASTSRYTDSIIILSSDSECDTSNEMLNLNENISTTDVIIKSEYGVSEQQYETIILSSDLEESFANMTTDNPQEALVELENLPDSSIETYKDNMFDKWESKEQDKFLHENLCTRISQQKVSHEKNDSKIIEESVSCQNHENSIKDCSFGSENGETRQSPISCYQGINDNEITSSLNKLDVITNESLDSSSHFNPLDVSPGSSNPSESFIHEQDSLQFNDTMEEMELALKQGLGYVLTTNNTSNNSTAEDKVQDKVIEVKKANSPNKFSEYKYVKSPVGEYINRKSPTPNFKLPLKLPRSSKPNHTPNRLPVPAYKNVVSPVAVYIKNSPSIHLKQNVPVKTVSSLITQPLKKMDKTNKENGLSNIPQVVYKPAKKRVEADDPNKIKLPSSIQKLVKSPYITKHEARINSDNIEGASSMESQLLHGDLTVSDSLLNATHDDISFLTKKQAFIT